jgi:hypothetical protein
VPRLKLACMHAYRHLTLPQYRPLAYGAKHPSPEGSRLLATYARLQDAFNAHHHQALPRQHWAPRHPNAAERQQTPASLAAAAATIIGCRAGTKASGHLRMACMAMRPWAPVNVHAQSGMHNLEDGTCTSCLPPPALIIYLLASS